MRYFTLAFLLISNMNIVSYSQETEITKIREIYTSIKTEDFSFHNLTFNSILPAVGPKQTTIKFYYKSTQTNPEVDPYAFVSKLKLIEVEYNISAHSSFHIEYLYNENEQLIFYFIKAEGAYENFENRYYFKNNNLIKLILKETDEKGIEFLKTTSIKFSETEIKNAEQGKLKAESYKRLYQNMLELEQVE